MTLEEENGSILIPPSSPPRTVLFANVSPHGIRDHRPHLRHSLRQFTVLGIPLDARKSFPIEQASEDDVAESFGG